MLLRLNRSSPTPLYHQIVQAIRWRIGTGELRAGDPLPTVRDAAERWGVNYHTVRRAYQELAQLGWIDPVQGAGTAVSATPPLDAHITDDELEQWLDQVVATGKDCYNLTPDSLAKRILQMGRVLRVVMVECNVHQLRSAKRESWSHFMKAVPWRSLLLPEHLDETINTAKLIGGSRHREHAEAERSGWPYLRQRGACPIRLSAEPANDHYLRDQVGSAP